MALVRIIRATWGLVALMFVALTVLAGLPNQALAQAPIALPAAKAAHAPPANLMPARISGTGLNVANLDAEKAWYETMLGMKTVQTYTVNGAPFEYIMATSGGGAILALAKAARPPGPNAYGRIILEAPDPRALAAALYGQGVQVREAIADTAYFVTDPEGNAIELYRAPKP